MGVCTTPEKMLALHVVIIAAPYYIVEKEVLCML